VSRGKNDAAGASTPPAATKKRGRPKSKVLPEMITGQYRSNEALNLRKMGASFAAIATHLKITPAGARQACHRELRRLAAANLETAAELRELECLRLDSLQSAQWAKAMAGDPVACDRVLKIVALREKMLGLGAPVRLEMSGIDGGAIEVDYVSALDARLDRLADATTLPDKVLMHAAE
jgi:hypothetical protein